MQILSIPSLPTFLVFFFLHISSSSFFRPSRFSILYFLFFSFLPSGSRGYVVGTLIRLQAGHPGARTPAETLNTPVLQNVVTDCGANQASQSLAIGRSFLGGKFNGVRS